MQQRNSEIMRLISTICLLTALLFSACQKKKFDDRKDMSSYVQNVKNGLASVWTNEKGIEVKVMFQPYPLLNGYHQGDSLFVDNLYFVLSFSANGKELLPQLPQEAYSSILQLFSFNMQDYVHIRTDDGQILEPKGVFFNPTYNMSQSNDLLVVFDKHDSLKGKGLEVLLNDFGLGLGERSFQFDQKVLKQALAFELINKN